MPDLHFEVLPPAQRRVWGLLAQRAERLRAGGYYLAGGTALALQLGHRQSVDFDFFSQETGLGEPTAAWLRELPDFTATDLERETVHGSVGQVKVSFLGSYKYPLLETPVEVDGIRLANLLDIGLMKLLAITHRATPRDYLDLAALFEHGYSLPLLLDASASKYGVNFNPMVPLRALTAFEDLEGEMPTVLDADLARSWKEVVEQAIRAAAQR